MATTETTATGSVVNERELTAEELDAATGGTLPEGFLLTIRLGIAKGILESGGSVTLSGNPVSF